MTILLVAVPAVAVGGVLLAPTPTAAATTVGLGIGGCTTGALAAAFWGSAILVGASYEASWDCWKPIVHDESPIPSKGMPLDDLLQHSNVQFHRMYDSSVLVQNKWNEQFLLQPVALPDGQVALHAEKVAEYHE
jgi:hypothetical protein